jgi:hypothetical protein
MEKELRHKIRRVIEESSFFEEDVEPKFDLSNVVSSDTMNKKYLKVLFKNSENTLLTLFVPIQSFSNWYNSSKPTGNALQKFVTEFINVPPVESEDLMKEIVDEFGDLIGSQDMPNNSTNSMVGNSKFGSDKAIRQTVAKVKNYDSNLGRGIVTW